MTASNSFHGFSPETFQFFDELAENNDRPWFADNKSRYEDVVLFPAMEFVAAMEKPLHKISPHFQAIPRRAGGSLMRIYRDIRFSKNKTPFKTNLGIHFRHEVGKDVHAPGFYFHLSPDRLFVGAGIWHPDNSALTQIRELIDDVPARWKRIKNKKIFRETFEISGESLKRPPQGYDESHALIDDLKRKDHFVLANLNRKDLYSKQLTVIVAAKMKLSLPYMRFLCDALHLPS